MNTFIKTLRRAVLDGFMGDMTEEQIKERIQTLYTKLYNSANTNWNAPDEQIIALRTDYKNAYNEILKYWDKVNDAQKSTIENYYVGQFVPKADEIFFAYDGTTLPQKMALINAYADGGNDQWQTWLSTLKETGEITPEVYEASYNSIMGIETPPPDETANGDTGTNTTGTTTNGTTAAATTGTGSTPTGGTTNIDVNITVPGDGQSAAATAGTGTTAPDTVNILGNEIPKDYLIYFGIGGVLVWLYFQNK